VVDRLRWELVEAVACQVRVHAQTWTCGNPFLERRSKNLARYEMSKVRRSAMPWLGEIRTEKAAA
jgi:hypothetical protein